MTDLILLDADIHSEDCDHPQDIFSLRPLLPVEEGGMMVKNFPPISVTQESQLIELFTVIRKNLRGLEHAIIDLNAKVKTEMKRRPTFKQVEKDLIVRSRKLEKEKMMIKEVKKSMPKTMLSNSPSGPINIEEEKTK
jgi:hypothetical protein